mgnify:CR=1 FL=1
MSSRRQRVLISIMVILTMVVTSGAAFAGELKTETKPDTAKTQASDTDSDVIKYSEGVEGGYLYYKLSEDGKAYNLVDCDTTVTSISLPGTVQGLPVGSYMPDVFEGCVNLISIHFPDDKDQFSIYALWECPALQKISFNESNQYYCSVDNVVFNKDKTQLVYYPLGKEDKEYTVPEGTKQVLTWAFPDGGTEYYPPIRVLNLPASLEPSKSLYDGSWVYPSFDLFLVESINMDSQNPYMCSEGGILFNKDKTQLIDYPAGRKDKSYTVPKGVIDISEAFYNCRYLSELIIPEGVEKVGGFAGSDNLHAITLPASVNDFHGGAGSSNLERVDVVEDNQKYTSIDGVVFLKNKNRLWYYPSGKKESSYHVPESTEGIYNGTLVGTQYLQDLYIPFDTDIIRDWDWYFLEGHKQPVTIHVYKNSLADQIFTEYETELDHDTKIEYISTDKPTQVINVEPEFRKKYGDGVFNLNASAKTKLSYSSNDSKVASVDENGNVTVKSPGDADITIRAAENETYGKGIKKTYVYVQKIEPQISFASQTLTKSKYADLFTNKLTTDSDGDVTYASSDPNVATVKKTTGEVTVRNTGTTTITASVAEGTYHEAGEASYTLNVTDQAVDKEPQTIQVDSSISKVYGNSDFDLGASAKTELSYSSSQEEVATVSGSGKVSIKGAGTAVITVTAKEDDTYESAEAKVTIQVAKAGPKLSFESRNVVKPKNADPFTNKLTKTTDGKISYTSSNASVASVDETTGEVTIKGTGTSVITAKAAEGRNYTAGSAGYTLTVEEKAFTLDKLTYHFSNSYAGLGYKRGDKIPLSSYQLIYNDTLAKFYYQWDGPWGGSCYGMSSTSGMFNTGQENIKEFKNSAAKVQDLDYTDRNMTLKISVKQFIEAMQVSQYDGNVQDAYNFNTGLNDLCKTVKDADAPAVIGIFGPQGGHALVAYDIRKISDTESRLYVYDCNYPDTERYIRLTTNAAGSYTGWYYHLNDTYNWGSSYKQCGISYVPYDTYANVWKNRAAKRNKTKNVLYADTDNFSIQDYNGDTVAYMKDGKLVSDNKEIYQAQTAVMNLDGTESEQSRLIYLPTDIYSVVNTDSSDKEMKVAMVNEEQSSTVTTGASKVTFAVNDEDESNLVSISGKKGSSYDVVMDSSLNDEKQEAQITGKGNGDKITAGKSEGKFVMDNCSDADMKINGTKVGEETSEDQKDISSLKAAVEVRSVEYTGKAQEPAVSVKTAEGKALQQGKDYVVIYKNNIDPGTAEATVYGIGDYKGKQELTFTITEKSGGNLFNGNNRLRVYGDSRYDTAVDAADAMKKSLGIDKFENIIVADGRNYPDALTGSYLAKVKDAPILLVNDGSASMIREYIKQNLKSGGTVYILGGTGAVSGSFEKSVRNTGASVKRLAGKSRYDTNISILKEAGVTKGDLLICSGGGFADSLSASAAGLPILLTGDTVSPEQKAYLNSLSIDKIYIIGGTGAVKESVEDTAKRYGTVERLAGKSRYDTSEAVAKKFFSGKASAAVIAYGQNFPDGLAGGPLAMTLDAPLLLAENGAYSQAAGFVEKEGIKKGIVMGGRSLISDSVFNRIIK